MTPFQRRRIEASGLGDIQSKVLAGERLSREDGLALYSHPDLVAVGALANHVRERQHGRAAYYIVNQHINYTNICVAGCKFCAFYRTKKQPGAYVLSPEVNPDLPFSYYIDIIHTMKRVRPEVHVKAFTMVEIAAMAENFEMPAEQVLARLRDAGLGSVPGGGAEILTDHAHQVLFKGKIDHNAWIEIAKTVHRAGLRSNATMLYGHVETVEDRLDHMLLLREAQDETAGFMAFVPLAFHPENTRLSHLSKPSAMEDLRQLAVGRLILDNFPHIKAYWIMMTPRVAQAGLHFGADDLDGTVVTEEIFHRAGAVSPQQVARQRLIRLIKDAARVPVERDSLYNSVDVPTGPGAERPVPVSLPGRDGAGPALGAAQ
jgi:aminodeoxyfutalosine synthase